MPKIGCCKRAAHVVRGMRHVAPVAFAIRALVIVVLEGHLVTCTHKAPFTNSMYTCYPRLGPPLKKSVLYGAVEERHT